MYCHTQQDRYFALLYIMETPSLLLNDFIVLQCYSENVFLITSQPAFREMYHLPLLNYIHVHSHFMCFTLRNYPMFHCKRDSYFTKELHVV